MGAAAARLLFVQSVMGPVPRLRQYAKTVTRRTQVSRIMRCCTTLTRFRYPCPERRPVVCTIAARRIPALRWRAMRGVSACGCASPGTADATTVVARPHTLRECLTGGTLTTFAPSATVCDSERIRRAMQTHSGASLGRTKAHFAAVLASTRFGDCSPDVRRYCKHLSLEQQRHTQSRLRTERTVRTIRVTDEAVKTVQHLSHFVLIRMGAQAGASRLCKCHCAERAQRDVVIDRGDVAAGIDALGARCDLHGQLRLVTRS